jgi:ABC-type Zn uptake system ZnuABC Zn-binding protein ZnuA
VVNATTITTSSAAVGIIINEICGNKCNANIVKTRTHSHDFSAIMPRTIMQITKSDAIIAINRQFDSALLKISDGKKTVILFDDNKTDGHIWSQPVTMVIAAQKIQKYLTENLPQHKQYFDKNTSILLQLLQPLLKKYSVLTSCNKTQLFTMHDGFFNLHKEYKLLFSGTLTDNIEHGIDQKTVMLFMHALKQDKICVINEPHLNFILQNILDKTKDSLKNVTVISVDAEDDALRNAKNGINEYMKYADNNLQKYIKCLC